MPIWFKAARLALFVSSAAVDFWIGGKELALALGFAVSAPDLTPLLIASAFLVAGWRMAEVGFGW